MRILFSLLLLMSFSFCVRAQDSSRIRTDVPYILTETKTGCSIELIIHPGAPKTAKLRVNEVHLEGILKRNVENPETVFNFCTRINSKSILILLLFDETDGDSTVTIANYDYLPLFRACWDAKYIVLRARE